MENIINSSFDSSRNIYSNNNKYNNIMANIDQLRFKSGLFGTETKSIVGLTNYFVKLKKKDILTYKSIRSIIEKDTFKEPYKQLMEYYKNIVLIHYDVYKLLLKELPNYIPR